MSGPRVLVTAFEPYDAWPDNASWQALVALARDLPTSPQVTTRRYPVDFDAVRQRLTEDLQQRFDFAIHLGQAPGHAAIAVETVALNLAQPRGGVASPIVPAAPLAYRTRLPTAEWVHGLRGQGIPAELSFHAGTYVCNATFFWSLHLAETQGLATQAVFLHIPLDMPQILAANSVPPLPCLPADVVARALRWILAHLDDTAPKD